MAKYSVLAETENLFASKYMLYLSTEEELKREPGASGKLSSGGRLLDGGGQ